MLDINNKIHEIDLLNHCFIPCLFIDAFHRWLQIKADFFFTDIMMSGSCDAVRPSYIYPAERKTRPKKQFDPNLSVFHPTESLPFPDKGKTVE